MKFLERVKKAFSVLMGKEENSKKKSTFVGVDPSEMVLVNEENSFLFDFHPQYTGSTLLFGGTSFDNPNTERASNVVEIRKIKAKPIDIVNELNKEPRNIDLENLDEKIEVLKKKKELVAQWQTKNELASLIERFENRKKYKEHELYFKLLDTTTEEKINALLAKYELVMKPADIFIPEMPKEAVDAMTSFKDKVQEICEKKPVFYVIAEPDNFRDAYGRRDPILLAQSPFGFYYYVLGAWDKEMLVVSEL